MKLTSEEREELDQKGKDLGLYYAISDKCISQEQQDIMLDLQEQVGFNKIVYLSISKNPPKRPTRDYEAAKKKLDDLFEYAKSTGDIDTWKTLLQVKLSKKSSYANDHRNKVKEQAYEKLQTIEASKTRRKILVKELMQYFDAYEPTKTDYDFDKDFMLDEEEDVDEDYTYPYERKYRDF